MVRTWRRAFGTRGGAKTQTGASPLLTGSAGSSFFCACFFGSLHPALSLASGFGGPSPFHGVGRGPAGWGPRTAGGGTTRRSGPGRRRPPLPQREARPCGARLVGGRGARQLQLAACAESARSREPTQRLVAVVAGGGPLPARRPWVNDGGRWPPTAGGAVRGADAGREPHLAQAGDSSAAYAGAPRASPARAGRTRGKDGQWRWWRSRWCRALFFLYRGWAARPLAPPPPPTTGTPPPPPPHAHIPSPPRGPPPILAPLLNTHRCCC